MTPPLSALVAPLIYFSIGVIQDYLIAKYYLALSRRLVWTASILAAIITLVTVKIFANVITSNETLLMVAYAIGTGTGCFLGIGGRKP
jgi:hypothetical protein